MENAKQNYPYGPEEFERTLLERKGLEGERNCNYNPCDVKAMARRKQMGSLEILEIVKLWTLQKELEKLTFHVWYKEFTSSDDDLPVMAATYDFPTRKYDNYKVPPPRAIMLETNH